MARVEAKAKSGAEREKKEKRGFPRSAATGHRPRVLRHTDISTCVILVNY